jgi:VanZ family protein
MLKDWLSNVLRNVIGNILIIHFKMRRIESNLDDQIALVGRDL